MVKDHTKNQEVKQISKKQKEKRGVDKCLKKLRSVRLHGLKKWLKRVKTQLKKEKDAQKKKRATPHGKNLLGRIKNLEIQLEQLKGSGYSSEGTREELKAKRKELDCGDW